MPTVDPELLESIAREVGTPTYVYDIRALDAAVARWAEVLPTERIAYSVKANGNLSLLSRLADHGFAFEVATPGEYGRVRAVGVPSDRVVFGGVPKAASTVVLALGDSVALLVAQSLAEVEMLETVDRESGGVEAAAGAAEPLRVGLRVRPSIRAGAHPSLHTGGREAKFGLPPEAVPGAWSRLAALDTARPTALAVHLGSGIAEAGPYARALDLLLRLAESLDPPVRELDLGGGLGVDYSADRGPDPAGTLGALITRAAERGFRVRVEPGRSLIARCGLLLTRVMYGRPDGDAPALVCDAGFTDFARPVLYGAEHRIVPVGGRPQGAPTVAVLGPTCESGDRLGLGRRLHGVGRDDLLAVLDAGAYGACMASNYMSRPRPAEVLVQDGAWRVVRPRERLQSLWESEVGAGSTAGRTDGPFAAPEA